MLPATEVGEEVMTERLFSVDSNRSSSTRNAFGRTRLMKHLGAFLALSAIVVATTGAQRAERPADRSTRPTSNRAVAHTPSDAAQPASNWYVDDDAPPGGDGLSWTTAFKHVQDALAAAGTQDEIRVAGGIYRPDEDAANPTGSGNDNRSFELLEGISLIGGYAGLAAPGNEDQRDVDLYTATLTGDLAENDGPHTLLDFIQCLGPTVRPGCEPFNRGGGTSIEEYDFRPWWNSNGGGENSDGIVSFRAPGADAPGPTITIDGFTVTGAKRSGGISTWDQVNVNIANCKILNNWGQDAGGGIILGGGGFATVTNSLIQGNYTDASGALNFSGLDLTLTETTFDHNRGGVVMRQNSNATITDCTFTEHREASALFNYGHVQLTDCLFKDNKARAVENAPSAFGDVDTSAVLRNCRFVGNSTPWDGAAFYSSGPATLINCDFLNNSAGGDGGGVHVDFDSAILVNCRFINNTAVSRGGGMYVIYSDASLTNCLFNANSAGSDGGGISSPEAGVHLVNSTIVNNAAQYGGGVAYADLTNCIVWGNSAPNDPQIQAPAGATFSNVEGGFPGFGNINTDPRFVDPDGLDDIPGNQDDNFRLKNGSPSVDSGNNAAVPPDTFDLDGDGDTAEPTPLDLAGLARFMDDPIAPNRGAPSAEHPEIVDMGAYETESTITGGLHLASAVHPPTLTCQTNTCACDPLDEQCSTFITPIATCSVDADCTIDLENSAVVVTSTCQAGECVENGQPTGDPCSEDKHCESPKAFYYPGDDRWYAIEDGLLTMSWQNNAGNPIAQGNYPVLSSAANERNVFEVSYFMDALLGSGSAAFVSASPTYQTVIRYNAWIKENSEPGNLNDKDIKVISGLIQVRDGAPTGKVVLQYTDGAPPFNPTVGFEVLSLTFRGFIPNDPALVGRRITPPTESDDVCGTKFIKNEIDGYPIAWPRSILSSTEIFNTTDIWPIRPSDIASRLQIAWYRRSANAQVDLETCWPVEITKHSAGWPTDPQINVIDENDPASVPTVQMQTEEDQRYCKAYRVYQEAFDGSGVLAYNPPGEDLKTSFAAQDTGYSVIRFESLSDEIGAKCGDIVSFDVVATYDKWDTSTDPGYPNAGQPVYDGAPTTWDIAAPIEQPTQHDNDTPIYPYGYLHTGIPYAADFYDGDLATGQIIPVNRTAMYPSPSDGQLEVWYFKPARPATGAGVSSGDFSEGVYWPHKVIRYQLDWPASTNQIIIEDRNGAFCPGPGCGPSNGYPELANVYSKGIHAARYTDKTTMIGWNPNDEHAQLIPASDSALKAFAVRDDDPWNLGEDPYALVYYPVEPADPQDAAQVTKWNMSAHEVIASQSDPVCAWPGYDDGTFDCFVYDDFQDVNPDNVVYAGAPISPPLYPVNYFSQLCVDEFYRPLTYISDAPGYNSTALWTDRTGLVWAVEDYDDGRSGDFPEGNESSSQIYLWENWVGDDTNGIYGTCDPWRDFGTGYPTPIRYTPTWPDVPPTCNWEGGDENCARPVTIGQTVAHGVKDQCGTVKFLHDSVNAVVIDPLECSAVFFPNELVLSQLNFAKLPPHLGGGEFSGGGFKVPARIEYVTAGSPLKLHEQAKCPDFLSERLLFVGIMTQRDRSFFLSMGGLREIDCYDASGNIKTDAETFCVAVDDLYRLSREQLGLRCLGGANDGKACTYSNDCPASCDPVCIGGTLEGQSCPKICVGGNNDGDACTSIRNCAGGGQCEFVCAGGDCIDMCPPGVCRLNTQERPHAVSLAGASAKPGWITVAFQNEGYCENEGAVVAVEVWNVLCGPETGRINVIEADCPFSEALVLQQSGDAGGEPQGLSYEWQVSIDYNPLDHGHNPDLATWTTYSASGLGAREVVLNGNLDPVYTLIDSWWRVRHRGYAACTCGGSVEPACPTDWPTFLSDQAPELNTTAVSDWTKPALSEGWIKRVVRKFNAFDQRIEEFHTTEIATYVNMIRQAGIRYEGPVALNCNPDNINALGLIETYATVLARARQFLGGAGLTETPDAANLALLLAASKISDLYMLLGNEAFADALDPTIGLFPAGGENPAPGAPESIFCFQGQLPDLLAEELSLLRGIDQIRDLDVDPTTGGIAATVYNRLPWNFTSTDGQIAYANNYQVTAVIDTTGEDGAMIRYPQGHGDAWGHYLTATKEFYKLLTSSFFNWVVSTEAVNIAGQAVPVTFEYERKFAAAAAAKARTGAAITNMTFRQLYSAKPEQKNGYPDSDPQRRWGVADWSRRAGQAAYLDWVILNSLLDDDDDQHDEGSIQKVDRTTVADIAEIATAFDEIQTTLDNADADLNPLGLANNVVPFGLNPGAIEEGMTHFDQIFERAVRALSSAVRVYEYANQNDQRLRSVQDAAEEFDALVGETEVDFTSRLIETFGRPYPEDIGPGGAYPADYDGPDLLHFDYVEPSALLRQDGVNLSGNAVVFQRSFPWTEIATNASEAALIDDTCTERTSVVDGSVCVGEITVDFNLSTDGFGLIKPDGWSRRIEPGEIQLGRSELLQALGQYLGAVARYEQQLVAIGLQVKQVRQTKDIEASKLKVRIGVGATVTALEAVIGIADQVAGGLRLAGQAARGALDGAAEASKIHLTVGLANGTNAPGQIISGTMKAGASAVKAGFEIGAEVADGVSRLSKFAVDAANRGGEIAIETLDGDLLEGNEIRTLQNLIAGLYAIEIEALTLLEAVDAASGKYRSTLGKGLRVLDQRTAYRQRSARKVSQYRYQDMAFRIFRNDALQKYRAQFDLAASYAYLAAKAYDYETALLGTDTTAGQRFLTDITKQRVLGQLHESFDRFIPLPGAGLAGSLADLLDNFTVLRTQLGFNNDAAELQRVFSLRWENYRIPNTPAFDNSWQQVLNDAVVADINQIPEYRQFALPLGAEGPTPGIVLRFKTDITAGRNVFGWPSAGDELYPTTYFAIKLHSVGLRFEDFPGGPLNNQVECYLLPTGADIMRVPSCTFPRIRNWNLIDQTLPIPLPIGESDFSTSGWMPWDGVAGGAEAFIQRRLYPTIPARPLADGTDQDLSFMLTGRSVWNTGWTMIIPGIALEGLDPQDGIDVFINGLNDVPGVTDIKLILNSYGYSGCTIGTAVASDAPQLPQELDVTKEIDEPEEFVPLPVNVAYPQSGINRYPGTPATAKSVRMDRS